MKSSLVPFDIVHGRECDFKSPLVEVALGRVGLAAMRYPVFEFVSLSSLHAH